MSQQTFVFDTRLPVSSNVADNDPSHPKNVMRNALIVQNQASADTKYDIYPPKRIEGFALRPSQDRVYIIAAILAVIVGITISINVENMIVRLLLIFIVIYSIHYLVGRLQFAYSN